MPVQYNRRKPQISITGVKSNFTLDPATSQVQRFKQIKASIRTTLQPEKKALILKSHHKTIKLGQSIWKFPEEKRARTDEQPKLEKIDTQKMS